MAEAIIPLLVIGGATTGAAVVAKQIQDRSADRLPSLPPPPPPETAGVVESLGIDTADLARDERAARRRRVGRSKLRINPSLNAQSEGEPVQGLRISQ